MNPYDPPESKPRMKQKTSLRPTDGIWLSPLEKMVSVVSGIMIVSAMVGAIIVIWNNGW